MRFLSTFLLMTALLACTLSVGWQPEKYVPKNPKKKEKLATPEPGTYLKPAAYALIRKFTELVKESKSIREPGDWLRDMITPRQKKLLDTVLQYQGLEVPVRIYYPTRESLEGDHPVTLFFHGGGFMMGSVRDYDPMVGKLAKITGNIFISVEYSLAPEHPFPAAIYDCFACLRWLQDNGRSIGADTARISVMGDSAGGNIAAVMTLMCRDRKVRQPAGQVLVYPGMTFTDTLFPSRIFFTADTTMQYVLSADFLRTVKEHYLEPWTSDRNPYVSPLEAELTGDLAPALVITAEVDPIRDGGRLFAERLRNAGVEVEHLEYSGMIHGFMSLHMIFRDAVDAMTRIGTFLDQL